VAVSLGESMEIRTASIEFHGRVLQYAEVASQDGGLPTLLRLGSCDFDFDVEDALFGPAWSDQIYTVTDALEEIFSGSNASSLHIALHPSSCTSFFTPIPAHASDLERETRIRKDLSRLNTLDAAYPPYIASELVRTEYVEADCMNWFHVLQVEWAVASRFERMMLKLSPSTHRFFTSTRSVATVVQHAITHSPPAEHENAPYVVAVGWYGTHIEYTISNLQGWLFSSFNHARFPSDSAYYVLALLQRLHISPRKVGRVFIYGNHPDMKHFSPFQSIFSINPEPLNPLLAFGPTHQLSNGFAAATYVPCIGASLKEP
jgi:hypothetical protein